VTADVSVWAPAPPLERRRRIPLRPAEGWLTVVATAAMALTFAGSLMEAEWLPASAGDTRFLLATTLLGLGFGFVGAKVGWGRWRTHFVGALFGGLLLPLIVGGVVIVVGTGAEVGWDPASLAARLGATFRVAQIIHREFVLEGATFTSQWAHYHLIFGVLTWAAGMLAGFTVFGHRRPLDAVVVIGLAILANMALTDHHQLWLLVIFSASALVLLIRTHVFEEEVTWARRRIGEPGSVGGLYMTSGAAFVTAAILGSVLLTFSASSAPLQGIWADLPRNLQDVSQWLQQFAPPGGDFRNLGIVGFGDSVTTNGVWEPSDRVAFRAQIPTTAQAPRFRWRAGAYAEYTRNGWDWGIDRRTPVPPGDALNAFSPEGDAPTDVGRRSFAIRITPDAFRDRTILGPNMIRSVDRATNAVMVGADGWYTTIETTESIGSYNVVALIRVRPDAPGGLTEASLRSAGTSYPAGLLATYTALPEGALGPRATALLEDIRAAVPAGSDPKNPYDLARTMETYLRNSTNFTYSEDVRPLRRDHCAGISTVECFATIRQGYCEYYASTMAVLLREAGVPTRVVYGFLPGQRETDGTEIVQAFAAHWWVEVFFPGIGWFEFDPTGGGRGAVEALPSGSIGPATPRPTGALPTFGSVPTQRTGGGVPPVTGPSAGVGPFIAIALILIVGVAALAWAAYRRVPRKPMPADQAWGSLSRLASRFGLGPRPSQTVFEYAGSLGEQVPAARVELTTLARAKVEVAYGKRDLGDDRLRRIAEAYHRLRIALIGVVLRRGLRRRRRR
jgi:transglutaminase-like putative cysteine protease